MRGVRREVSGRVEGCGQNAEELTSELEGTRAAAQESLEKAKDRKRIFNLLLDAAKGETEELGEQLEKLNLAVGPQQQHSQPERGWARIHRSTTREPSVPPVEVEPLHEQREATAADLQGGHSDSVVQLLKECMVRRFATKRLCYSTLALLLFSLTESNCVTVPDIDFQRRALPAEAALVRFHFGVGIVSSTLCEMLKDLTKWPRKVKIEEEDIIMIYGMSRIRTKACWISKKRLLRLFQTRRTIASLWGACVVSTRYRVNLGTLS